MPTKRIEMTIVENSNDYGLNIEPALLLKLLGFAHNDANSEEQLYSIVARSQLLAETTPVLEYNHYGDLVTTTKSLNNSTETSGDVIDVAVEPATEEVVETPNESPPGVVESPAETPTELPQ